MFKFNSSFSTVAYRTKPDSSTDLPFMPFRTERDITLEQFIDKITDGRSYTGVYSSDSFVNGNKERSLSTFSYTNIVSIDIDDSEIPMREFVDGMRFKPTVSYYTFTRLKEGKYRFRLVYVFSDSFSLNYEYKDYLFAILASNGIPYSVIDCKATCCANIIHGTCHREGIISTNVIYTKEDFNPYLTQGREERRKVSGSYSWDEDFEIGNGQFKEDVENEMNPSDIAMKYSLQYEYLTKGKEDVTDAEKPFLTHGKDYDEIFIQWTTNNNGKTPKVRRNGEHRRNYLYMNAMIRRGICPSITFDELVYCTFRDLEWLIDNTEDVIYNYQVVEIARNAMCTDLSTWKQNNTSPFEGKRYINKNYCMANNVKCNVKSVESFSLSKEIEKLFDRNLTYKDNLKLLHENGIDISEKTLKRWAKNNGIRKYKVQGKKKKKTNKKKRMTPFQVFNGNNNLLNFYGTDNFEIQRELLKKQN